MVGDNVIENETASSLLLLAMTPNDVIASPDAFAGRGNLSIGRQIGLLRNTRWIMDESDSI